ncbi:MAG TPA: septum formation protein Maf [Microscillaceae bacterium]|nr:septum formation protein Maf [Microscillaceae bacterium]
MTQIILASGSPRRKELLASLGVDFQVKTKPIDETFPADLPAREVATYIAKAKAEAFAEEIKSGKVNEQALVITADTVVILGNEILAKPADKKEAQAMLQALSGSTHLVITGVCILTNEGLQTFDETTSVVFKALSAAEIDYYIDHYQPFDKAGAYGIQEWIGMVGIERIEGDYYNVVGLPVHKVYAHLKQLGAL